MNNEFLSYEQSLSLKELGFDEPCFGWYSNMDGNTFRQGYCETYLGIENCAKAPLYQQAFRWFHKNHNLYSWVEKISIWNEYFYVINPHNLDDYKQGEKYSFKTPEETESALIDKLIEIVKNKSN
jgi:hypothetical protein